MSERTDEAQATREYAAAHAAHYSDRDLVTALRPYGDIIAAHESTREGACSRTQVQNTASIVIPSQQLLGARMELARVCLEDQIPPFG